MKPIEIKIAGHVPMTSQEICAQIVNTERWPDFKGYSILPGIKKADFVVKTPGMVGSKIQVHNTDGSTHVEEIIQWDVDREITLRFGEFQAPLKNIASHFIETWQFQKSGDGTNVTRRMTMVPKGLLGWFMLAPISYLMKKSFEQNLAEFSGRQP